MKCIGCPRKPWFAQVDSLNNDLNLPDKVLDVKLILKTLDQGEFEEFEMAPQHKSKVCTCIFRVCKWEVGFKEYLEYLKVAPTLVLKFHLGTLGLFEELGRRASRDESQECPNCVTCKESVECILDFSSS